MRISRFMLPLVAAVGAALLAAAPASAQNDYPPLQPLLSATPTTIFSGETVVVTGEGYQPNEPVELTVNTTPFAAAPLVSEVDDAVALVPVSNHYDGHHHHRFEPVVVQTDGFGNFTTTIRLFEVGRAQITGTGLESGLSASAYVTVLAKKKHHKKHALPITGSSSGWLLTAGAGTVVVGTMLLAGMLVWRRRAMRIGA